jgi:hypothetical protein
MKHFDYESIRERVVDGFGRKVILSLFTEFQRTEFEPIWSLHKDWKPIYMACNDPTEYETAMRLIGDWDHYQAVRNYPKIKIVMDKWAREMEIKIRSEAVRNMFHHSKQPNGAAAAKWVAEGSFMQRVLKNKEARQAEADIQEGISERISADAERLGLRLIAGGSK